MPYRGQFALRQRPLDAGRASLSAGQLELWDKLEQGPVPLADLLYSPAMQRHLGRLVDRGLVAISQVSRRATRPMCSACRATGTARRQSSPRGSSCAARPSRSGSRRPRSSSFAATWWSRWCASRARSSSTPRSARPAASIRIIGASWGATLIRRSLSATQPADALFISELKLNAPLAAIGAPVGSYYPEIAKRLRTRLVIPPHADVSNAVGAVAGGVLQRVTATITQPQEGLFRAHLATGIKDFVNLEEAARYCSDLVSTEAVSLANVGPERSRSRSRPSARTRCSSNRPVLGSSSNPRSPPQPSDGRVWRRDARIGLCDTRHSHAGYRCRLR